MREREREGERERERERDNEESMMFDELCVASMSSTEISNIVK